MEWDKIRAHTYDVSSDSQRFLLIKDNAATDQTSTAPVPCPAFAGARILCTYAVQEMVSRATAHCGGSAALVASA